MADPSPSPRSDPPKAPRWAKVSAVVVGVLILLAVIVKLTGLGGDHGPGRHMGIGETPSTGVSVIQTSGGHPAAYAPEAHR
ncbi:hypothetical protein QFZ82_006564 [Streptomyces sp. V4I23]|uniref:hypothetical protein n=1 Tax=Streptomyces sp. V4I23 TaxID=3042282 RepID=UPI00277D895A|nr:hypothetical protein [Streptomyces sp. V4I23]MDQ1012079.1 hypothetical protein [Streptomyces sp. V4I23]